MTVATLLIVHALVTAMMTGLIWFVQIVHYPLFAAIGGSEFIAYEKHHQLRTTWVVAPLMGVELVTAAALPFALPAGSSRWLAYGGLALLTTIWASTALVQVPFHERLGRAPSQELVVALVASNWIRTAAWTLRTLLAGYILYSQLTITDRL